MVERAGLVLLVRPRVAGAGVGFNPVKFAFDSTVVLGTVFQVVFIERGRFVYVRVLPISTPGWGKLAGLAITLASNLRLERNIFG